MRVYSFLYLNFLFLLLFYFLSLSGFFNKLSIFIDLRLTLFAIDDPIQSYMIIETNDNYLNSHSFPILGYSFLMLLVYKFKKIFDNITDVSHNIGSFVHIATDVNRKDKCSNILLYKLKSTVKRNLRLAFSNAGIDRKGELWGKGV